jgi:hypothetical protein
VKNRVLIAIVGVVVLIGTFVGGWAIGSNDTDSKPVAESTTSTTQTTMAHTHDQLELDESQPVPTATISVTKDMKMGYNLKIVTTDFTFTPQNASMADAAVPQSEGHAHLYINHEKITRLYGEYFYISSDLASPGDDVMITLNTNSHKDIVESNKVVIE